MGHDRLMYLRRAEEVDEDEEEICYKSDRTCDECGEKLVYTDEIFVLEVVEAAIENGTLFLDVLRDDDGDDLFQPYLVHIKCWEEALIVIDEAVEDQPPLECENAILQCTRCESTIGSFEPFVSAQFGEIHASPRFPSGQKSAEIKRLDTRSPVCLLCMRHVIEEHFIEWEDLLEFADEMVPAVEEERKRRRGV